MVDAKRILIIQSEVAFGHVGNGAARFALQRLGFEAIALPTVLLSNHPGHKTFAGETVPTAKLAAMLDALVANGFLDGVVAVISGYLGEPTQAEFVRSAVERVKALNPSAFYCLDPVFGDDDGAYAKAGVAEAMARHLMPIADIVTPNRFELGSLTGRRIDDPASALTAARSLGRPLVVATSIPSGTRIATIAVTRDQAWMAEVERIAGAPNGSGDLLTSLFSGRRANSETIDAALGHAVASVDAVLRASAGAPEMRLIERQAALVEPPALTVRPLSS